MTGTQASQEIFNNLINPAVLDKKTSTEETAETGDETGYKSSERSALEKQLLQIENAARAEEERAAAEAEAAATAARENTADDVQPETIMPEYGSEEAPVTSD